MIAIQICYKYFFPVVPFAVPISCNPSSSAHKTWEEPLIGFVIASGTGIPVYVGSVVCLCFESLNDLLESRWQQISRINFFALISF